MWTCAWIVLACFVTLWPARLLVAHQAGLGIRPLVPGAAIPWIAAAFVVLGTLALLLIWKINLPETMAKIIVLTIGLVVFGFSTLLVFHMYTAKRTEPWERILPTTPDAKGTNQQ